MGIMDKPLLSSWAQKETDLVGLLRGLKANELKPIDPKSKETMTVSILGRITTMIEWIAFACSSDHTTSHVKKSTVAERYGVNRKTVIRWYNKAKLFGLIETKERHSDNGSQLADETKICWETIKKFCRQNVTGGGSKCHGGRVKMSRGEGQNVPPLVTHSTHRSSSIKNPMGQENNSSDRLDGFEPAECDYEIALRVSEALSSRFQLKRAKELEFAGELAKSFGYRLWDVDLLDNAISETLKRRGSKPPPQTGFAKLNYLQSIVLRQMEERECR